MATEFPSLVDFAYAFATPHRMTVARPDSGDKTLLDLQPGSLRLAWTYDSPKRFPLGAFMTPTTSWELRLTPSLDGHPFAHSSWARAEGALPVLQNEYYDARGWVQLQVVGGAAAALVRITLDNPGDRPHRFALRCERPGNLTGYNPAWVDPREPGDVLLAGWAERADRVVLLALGAQATVAPAATVLQMEWLLAPGEVREAWLVRPYCAYAADLPALRGRDWASEFQTALAEWRALLARAIGVSIPDSGVQNAYYACLSDLFVMREPVAGGYTAATPGTEVYRAPNSFEAGIVAVALDQAGLHEEAAAGYQMCLDQQEPDGDWSEPRGWGHLMWGASGFKAWAINTHHRTTGDRAYLERQYPRLVACSRWQERQRQRSRRLVAGARPLEYGLLPRGMGDCGLKDGDDLYGVFLPHNIWAVYADRIALETADLLGRTEDLAELRGIYERGLADLSSALERGAIQGQGYRWIPGVPGKTSGSRWGALNALFPCGLLPPDHELVAGTIQEIESRASPGGQPLNTGWMPEGSWVAITLDNLAEAHLARGEGDAAVEYLYSTLNHGTPLYTWCEERGKEPGSSEVSGDRQHLFTPVAVTRAIRDMLVMEQGDTLHLGLGIARRWLSSGQSVGLTGAPTHHGDVSFEMRYDVAARKVVARATFADDCAAARATLHVRLHGGLRVLALTAGSQASVAEDGESITWLAPRGNLTVEAEVG